MAKATLNLKIKKANIINSLEKALAERTKRYEGQKAQEDKHAKEMEVYYASIIKLVKAGKAKVTETTTNSYHWRKKKGVAVFSLEVEIPNSLAPKEPKEPLLYSEWEYKSDKEALENALRLLQMCEDEYVSAGTLKSINQYL